MRSACLNFPWYCDACEIEVWNSLESCWRCPFDNAVSKIPVLEADIVHFMESD